MKTYNQKITNLPNSEVEIEAELTWEQFLPYRTKTVESLKKTVEIKGFRAGHVSEDILVRNVSEINILQEASKDAIAESYGKIILEENIKAIGYPEIHITKLANGNPLSFKAKTSVMPEIKLPDYKKIASDVFSEKVSPVSVSEKELSDAIDEIRRHIARAEHDHKHETGEPHEHVENEKDLPLPEVNDEFVKKIGSFKDVSDFKEKIKLGLIREKEAEAKDKRRIKVSENILKNTEVATPKVFVDHELEKIEARFKSDIERMGLKVDEYLKHIKKTTEEMKKEWLPDAKKRATVQLIVSAIADTEKILASPEEIKIEADQIMKEHKDAIRERVEEYVSMIVTNEKVFRFLENQR